MVKSENKKKLEELNEVIKESNESEDINIDELIRKEFDIIEDRLFKGLGKTILQSRDLILRQMRFCQDDIRKLDKKVTKLLNLANQSMGVDEEELKRQQEIAKLEKRLEELKGVKD